MGGLTISRLPAPLTSFPASKKGVLLMRTGCSCYDQHTCCANGSGNTQVTLTSCACRMTRATLTTLSTGTPSSHVLPRLHQVWDGAWNIFTPTDLPTKVFYRDVVIDSCSGGQQGCPLMTACHAVVHRFLLESLGLVRPPAATAVTLPCPCCPDDGLLAGPSAEVFHRNGMLLHSCRFCANGPDSLSHALLACVAYFSPISNNANEVCVARKPFQRRPSHLYCT